MNLRAFLHERMGTAFAAAGVAEPLIGVATRPEFGDYQANGAMAAAKQARTAPRSLAAAVVEALGDVEFAESVMVEHDPVGGGGTVEGEVEADRGTRPLIGLVGQARGGDAADVESQRRPIPATLGKSRFDERHRLIGQERTGVERMDDDPVGVRGHRLCHAGAERSDPDSRNLLGECCRYEDRGHQVDSVELATVLEWCLIAPVGPDGAQHRDQLDHACHRAVPLR